MNLTDRTTAALTKLREIAELKGVSDRPWIECPAETTPKTHYIASVKGTIAQRAWKKDASFIAGSRTITPALAKALIVAIEGYSKNVTADAEALAIFNASLDDSPNAQRQIDTLNSILEIVEAL